MKTSILALTMLSLGAALCAQTAPQPSEAGGGPSTKVPRAIDPAVRSNMLAKTGGIVLSPVEGPSMLVLNLQTRVATVALNATVEQFQKLMRLPVLLKAKASEEPVTEALKALLNKDTAAVVVIADSPGYPSLLVAPESRWVLVNVAALDGEGCSAERLAERTLKELWRAVGYLMGAAYSTNEHCVLKPVFSAADLDALETRTLCPEPFGKIMDQAKKLGMKLQRMTTYRKAVEEGWAPSPTNDFQKAIWNELKK